MIAGLVGAVLVLSLGGASDFAMQLRARNALQDAADAAVLAGAKQLEKDITASPVAAARAMALANLPADLKGATLTTTVDQASRRITVTASASVRTSFLPIAQISSLPVTATATSSIQQEQHNDLFVMLDVSESMNLAASDADRDKLEAYTKSYNNRPCAFACHQVEWWAAPISVYEMNKTAKARLRIDVVRDAVDMMIDKILSQNGQVGGLRYNRISTAGFSWDFQKGVELGTDAAALKASIRNFSVANNHTRFWWAFSQFETMIGAQGTGTSAASPQKVAVIVTDGVRDEDGGFGWWGLGPLDPNLCRTIKDRGIKLAILEIKYVPRPGEYFYDSRVSWYYPQISPNLKSCASDGAYFMATDADQAANAMAKLTDTLISDLHLVN